MMDSPDANTSLIPSMSLTMGGGSHFAVYDPIIIISTQVVVQAVHLFHPCMHGMFVSFGYTYS